MKTQRMILKQGIIARHTDGYRRYFGWPTVCCDENGVLYAIVSKRLLHVCPFGQVCLYRSEDGGETWSEPQVVVDDAYDDRDAGIFYLGNGKMIMSYFTHPIERYEEGGCWYNGWANSKYAGLTEEAKAEVLARMASVPKEERHAGSYVRLSEDYGKTWSDDIPVSLSAPHGPTQLNDGRLMYVGTTHYLNDYRAMTGDETKYPDVWAVCAIVSEDGGKTWQKLCDMPMPNDWHGYAGGHYIMCEPHVLQRKNGHLIAVMREDDNNEIIRRSERENIYISYSQNGGKTWTIPVPVKNCDGEIVIGSPPHLYEMEDGGIVLSYSRRVAPCGNRAIISYDGGYNWGEEIILGQNWNPEDEDLGYPATAQLKTGELVTVYYQKYLTDFHTSLLYTKWDPKKQ